MSKTLEFIKKHLLDGILYIVVIALGVTGLCLLPRFFSSENGYILEVNVDGDLLRTIDLNEQSKEEHFEVAGVEGPVTIGVKHNAAAILSSPCPNQFCVRLGYVENGAPIICAYSHVALYFSIPGEEEILL